MKKILILTLCFLFFIFSACKDAKGDWKTVYIEDCGSIKLPSDWECVKKDDLYYVFDAEGNPIMIEWQSEQEVGSNEYYHNFAVDGLLSSAVYSNSAMYGEYNIKYNEEILKLFFLDFQHQDIYYESIVFLVWDKSIDLELVKDIAKTFDGTATQEN